MNIDFDAAHFMKKMIVANRMRRREWLFLKCCKNLPFDTFDSAYYIGEYFVDDNFRENNK